MSILTHGEQSEIGRIYYEQGRMPRGLLLLHQRMHMTEGSDSTKAFQPKIISFIQTTEDPC